MYDPSRTPPFHLGFTYFTFATQTVCWNSSAIHPTIQRYGKAEEAEEKNEEQKDEKKEEILGEMRKLFFL